MKNYDDRNGYRTLTLDNIDAKAKGQIVGYVTPELAELLLMANFDNNRSISERTVSFLVQQMKDGNWIEADSIKLSEDFRLIDGQHRLTAVVRYGKPVIFRIDTGLPFNTAMVLDTGKKRTTVDMAHIMGFSEIDRYDVSIFRGMVNLQKGNKGCLEKYSAKQIAELIVEHKEALDFSKRHYCNKGGSLSAAVLSVFACAWYTQDREKLDRFIKVFQTADICEPIDKSPMILRRITEDYIRGKSTSALEQLKMLQKAQSAVQFYLKGKIPQSSHLLPTKKLLYVVPSIQAL